MFVAIEGLCTNKTRESINVICCGRSDYFELLHLPYFKHNKTHTTIIYVI